MIARTALLLAIIASACASSAGASDEVGALAKTASKKSQGPAPFPSAPDAAIARGALERMLADELALRRDVSRIEHRNLLVAAANAGSLAAAARLIDLGWFEAMRRVEVERPQLAVWSGSVERVGDTTAGAIHAQLWINRLDALPGITASFRADQQEDAVSELLARDVQQPTALLDAACVLAQDGEPEEVARARALAARALAAIAAAGFAGDDLLLVEGRGEAYLACLDYFQEPDFAAAARLFAAASAGHAARGDVLGSAILVRLQALAAHAQGGVDEEAERLMVAAAKSFAQLGDHARRGRCLHDIGTWYQPERDGSGDRERALGWFRQAAAASQRGADWGCAADSFASMAWCRYPDVPDRLTEPDGREPFVANESDWGRAAAAFAAAAAAHALDGDFAAQAHDLYSLGICLDPTLNPMGSWLFAIPVLRAAEDGFARSADTTARAWNLCVLGEALLASGDRPAAVPVLHAAAGLALQESEQDLLERVQTLLSPNDP